MNTKKINLFLDTSNMNCNIIIFNNQNDIIDLMSINCERKHTDNTINNLNKLLTKNKLIIRNCQKLYIIKGPGAYTGIRVTISIAKTLKLINKEIEIYSMSSLLFLVNNSRGIGLIYADRKKTNCYLAIYKNDKEIIPEQFLTTKNAQLMINNFSDLKIYDKYNNISIKTNFFNQKNKFKICKTIETISPNYIKEIL